MKIQTVVVYRDDYETQEEYESAIQRYKARGYSKVYKIAKAISDFTILYTEIYS